MLLDNWSHLPVAFATLKTAIRSTIGLTESFRSNQGTGSIRTESHWATAAWAGGMEIVVHHYISLRKEVFGHFEKAPITMTLSLSLSCSGAPLDKPFLLEHT